MRKTICVLIATVAVLSVPAVALAGGGDAEVIKLTVLHAINLVFLIGILVFFVRKPLRKFLTERRSKFTADLEEAARLREEASALLTDYETRISGLEQERASLLEDYRQMGEAERDRIIEAARVEADRIAMEATATMAQEVERAKHTLESQVVEMAVQIAEQTLKNNLDASSHDRLVEGFLTGLESDVA